MTKILALETFDAVKNGKSKYANKHGKRNSVAYKAWDGIMQRCYNKNQKYYHNYGGRGIGLHKEWKDSFIEFYKYVSKLNGYQDVHLTSNHSEKITIERIDTSKGYVPGNIEWIQFKHQVYNRRLSKTNKSGYTGVFLVR